MAFGAFLFYGWFSSLEFDLKILICIILGCCEIYPEPSFELYSLEGLYSYSAVNSVANNASVSHSF